MRRDAVRIVFGAALGLLAVASGGCGDRVVEVSGRVTYNGAPLNKPGGQIVFVGPKGTQVVTAIGSDGTYRAAGVPAGPNRVVVYYPNPEAQRGKRFPSRTTVPPSPPPPFLTPLRYASADTSGLAVQADTGTTFHADLTGPEIP
jgi:hypothetical protein